MRHVSRRALHSFLAVALIALAALFAGDATAEPRFILNPSVSISEVYDDNVFPGISGPKWDIYTVIEPSFNADLSLRFGDLSLGYNPTFMLFPRHFKDPYIEEILHDASFSWTTVFTGGLSLKLSDRFYTLPIAYTRADFTPSNVAQSNEVMLDAGYDFDISPTMEASSNARFSRFDVWSGNTDGMMVKGSLTVFKSFNSIFRLGIVNNYMKYWYDDIASDPFAFGIGIKPEYEITPNIESSVTFGYRYLVLGGLDNESSFRYKVNFDYNTSSGKVASIYVSQDFMVDLSGNSFDSTEFGFTLKKKLLPRVGISSNIAFSILQDKALPAGADTAKILSVSPSVNFELYRDFLLSLGYNGFYNKWGNSSDNLSNNRVYITLTYSKSR